MGSVREFVCFRRALAPAAALVACAWIGAAALAVPPAVPPANQDPRERDLAHLRERIAELEQALAGLDQQAGDLLGSYARNRARMRLQTAKVLEAEAAFGDAVAREQESAARVAELEAALDARRALLRQRLLAIDRFAREGYLRLFLEVDRSSDLLLAIRQLRYLSRRHARAVVEFRAARDGLVAEQRELERLRSEAERWLAAERDSRAELDALLAEQARLLRSLEERRARLERSVGDLGQRESRLARLVELLEDESGTELAGVAVDEFQGALDWPAAGPVVTEFGPRTDRVYGTKLPHNGVEIATTVGAAVRAVYPGRVLFAAPFQDLGFTVVVEHPGRVLTVYSGLARLEVEEGDVLAFEAVVGRASERLYFEVRRDRKPEDPRGWLR